MLNWVNKVMGRVDAETGVPKSWVASLETRLARLDDKKFPNLAKEVLEFVLSGEPNVVLGQLAGSDIAAEALGVSHSWNSTKLKNPTALYEGFDAVPATVALRWARVLETAAAGSFKPQGSYTPYQLSLPNGVHWPELLLLNGCGTSLNSWSNESYKMPLSAAHLEAMLVAAGLEPWALLNAGFLSVASSSYYKSRGLMVASLKGYAEAVDRHLESLRPLFANTVVAQRLQMLAMCEGLHDATLARLAIEIVEFAVSGSKQVRAAAEALLARCGAPALAALAEQAVAGKPEQRLNALRLLYARGDDAQQQRARELAGQDKAPSVAALMAEWDEIEAVASQGVATKYDYVLPAADWSNALTPGVSQALDVFWQRINEGIEQSNQQQRAWQQTMAARGQKVKAHEQPLLKASDLERLKSAIAAPKAADASRLQVGHLWQHLHQTVPALAGHAAMNAPALIKTLAQLGALTGHRDGLTHFANMAFNILREQQGSLSLLELWVLLEPAGVKPEDLISAYCTRYGGALAARWPDAAVWPFFAHHLDALVRCLSTQVVASYYFDRSGLFRAVATLPTPPPVLVNALFDIALGSGKTDRAGARAALDNLPGKEARIINALSDGKADVRTQAAIWLDALKHEGAIPALEAAVAKEKQDVPKGAMLDALQGMGQPVEKYLDRAALAKEAEKARSKELPKDIDWFPWSALPAVRWADTLASVPADVVRLLLVQAVKQKSPEPNAVLRKFCALFEPRDREQLGQFVLENWLREDIRPIAPDKAKALAEQDAKSTHQSIVNYPQYSQNSPYLGRSVEEITGMKLPAYLRQPAGSAVGSKGVLALAAACAGERAAAPVARYLKEWYGTRAAQGKALIAMLAWIEHPSATQLMLSIGNRFRTKSFQEEATRQAEALAERKNWTLAELADRTMPSAGFDEAGELELSYGERSFTARLVDDFKIELFNPDGKKIASLPEPRQDDDEERAKDAKKAFSAAKKEIKNIVTLQTERLYEALCTERDWSYADWSEYLNRHPVVRRLLQRLVWVEIADGKVVQSFRPLDDGTLTDREDNELTLAAGARVRLAHDSILAAEEVAGWQRHLVDYRIAPLFQQLGKGSYVLPEAKAKLDHIGDFEGHMLEAFALRGRALKLGYTRGAAEDGGWFHVYEKRFPTLGLTAVLEFSGNPLPEENRNVALHKLSFATAGENRWQRSDLPLAEVPKVLLSECYQDLRMIAAEGTGYDPDWRKKSEY